MTDTRLALAAWADPDPHRRGWFGRYQTDTGVKTVPSRFSRRVAMIFGTEVQAKLAASAALLQHLNSTPRPRSSGAQTFAVAKNGRNVRTISLPRSYILPPAGYPGPEGPKRRRPVTKAELIAAIALETGESKASTEAFLAATALVVRKALKEGDELTIPSIGKLSAAKRDARTARNPSTGATIDVPAKTVVKFKVTKDLADAVA